jgi:hypothetical protein
MRCSLIGTGTVAYKLQLRVLAAGGLHRTATVDLPGPSPAARRSEATEENGELLQNATIHTCILRVVEKYDDRVLALLLVSLSEKRVLAHGGESQGKRAGVVP